MTMMRVLGLLLLLAAALPAAPGGKYVTVELENGQKIPAKVLEEECTDEVLVVRQIRPPKKMTIPWAEVKEEQRHTLRIELGFEAAESAPTALMMEATRIKNRVGNVFTGLLMNADTARKDGVYILKTSEGERRIRVTDVLTGPETVTVSKLEVYTPSELYEMRIKEHPPETAEDHYLVAEFCFSIDALEEAKLHYQKALELNDPKYSAEKLERNLARVQRLLDQSEARAALKEIKRLIVYNRFDKAAEAIAAFKEKYAAEQDLVDDAESLAQECAKEKDAYYTAQVHRLVRDLVKDLLEKKIKDEKELTLRDAQRYAGSDVTAEDGVSRQAIDQIASKLEIPADDVYRYWTERPKRNTYKAFYRDGTFIILDNLEDALSKAPKPPSNKGGKAGPTPPKPTPQMKPDDWWELKKKAHKYSDLRDWLFAFWAEKSQMCELLEPKDEMCPTCNGKGYTQTMIPTPQGTIPFFNRCQTCYMAKEFRIVQFK